MWACHYSYTLILWIVPFSFFFCFQHQILQRDCKYQCSGSLWYFLSESIIWFVHQCSKRAYETRLCNLYHYRNSCKYFEATLFTLFTFDILIGTYKYSAFFFFLPDPQPSVLLTSSYETIKAQWFIKKNLALNI